MNKLKIIFFIFIIYIIYINNSVNAAINFAISPIKFEIEAFTWTTIYKTASIRNKGNSPVTLTTWATDFQANWTSWTPQLVTRRSELVFPDQELSPWITLATGSLLVNPWEKKDLNFRIDIPNNATPWWHYWAVCFKNNNSETSSTWNIWINIDYCVLLLINVDWEISTEADVEDTVINSWWWWGGWWGWWGWEWNWESWSLQIDECPYLDLTASKYDWKCIDDLFSADELEEDIIGLNLDEDSELEEDDFNISFDTIFINEWNTHIVPKWKITLLDSEWNEIKWVWKITIRDENWVEIGEKIVDYLPLNDQNWNVLPSQKRNFNSEWKWFPYEGYDENWKIIIKYWSPEAYYTKQNTEDNRYLMPWERVNERIKHEKINANIFVSYIDKDWEMVEFNSAKEFYIDYREKYIWVNPYVVICSILIFIIVFLIWIVFRKKRLICINKKCKKKLDDDMKVCPYCWTKQKDKRFWKKEKKSKN